MKFFKDTLLTNYHFKKCDIYINYVEGNTHKNKKSKNWMDLHASRNDWQTMTQEERRVWKRIATKAGLPGSRRGFVNRGKRKAGLGLRSASLPLDEATPLHQRESREILPTVYRQNSRLCNKYRQYKEMHFNALNFWLRVGKMWNSKWRGRNWQMVFWKLYCLSKREKRWK